MKTNINGQTAQLNIAHRRQRRWQKIVTVLAAIVVFCTTYALILPAITWERQLICTLPVHTHTANCYETTVVPAGTRLACGLPEHTHTDECYTEKRKLNCVLEETEGHTHGEGCFDENGELICSLAETGAHTHTDECYEITLELNCSETEHTHSEDCYEVTEEHEETVVVCGYEEHTHTVECFDAPPAKDDGYFCGKVEHTHNDYCYFDNGDLLCTLPEHHHTAACSIDPEADIETAKKWEHSFNNVKLTGDRGTDLAAIAETQLGYTASKANYVLDENGLVSGRYNRYGVWYDEPYAAWNTHFVGFCMQYADAGTDVAPFDPDTEMWIDALRERELFTDTDAPEELPVGSILFYRPSVLSEDNEDDEDEVAQLFDDADDVSETVLAKEDKETEDTEDTLSPIRTAIVTDASFEEESGDLISVTAIEGDIDGCVEKLLIRSEDIEIVGYAVLPAKTAETEENEEDEAEKDEKALKVSSDPENTLTELVSKPASDGAVAVITGAIPAGAEAMIEAQTLTGDDLVALFGEKKAATMKSFVAYDIKIMLDGEEWQPDDTVSVTVRQPAIEIKNTDTVNVAHVNGGDETVKELEVSIVSDDSEIVFDTDGFSLYVFYTVDFHFEGKVFSINGYESIYLSELFEMLDIEQNAADAVNVTFSEPTLVSVEDTDGDWLLTSLAPFSTTETLTMDFGDEGIYTLSVTDAAEYWKEITSSDELVAGKTYMITNSSNKYALTYGADSYRTSVTFTATDAEGYYTANVADTMRFKLTSGNVLDSVSNPGTCLNLGGSFFKSGTRKLAISRRGDYWEIKRDGEASYLSYSNKKFAVANSTGDSNNMHIYMLTDKLPSAETEYWQIVDKIDDVKGEYLIVRDDYALVDINDNNAYTISGVRLNLKEVSGKSGYYTTTATVTDAMRMKFETAVGTSGKSKLHTNETGTHYLYINDTGLFKNGDKRDISFTYSNGYWVINNAQTGNSIRYLTESDGSFSRTKNGASQPENAKMKIYKKVTLTDDPGTDEPSEVSEYYHRVATLTSGKEYLIVSAQGSYALKYDGSTYSSVPVVLQPVKGNPEVYKINDVTDSLYWRLPGAGGSSSVSSRLRWKSSSSYLRLDGTSIMVDTTNGPLTFTYNEANGTWTIKNANSYYLVNNAGNYKSSNSTKTTEQRNFIILEKTTEPKIPDDPVSGGGSSGGSTPTTPIYDPYVAVSGGKSNVTTKQGFVPGVAYSDPSTSQIESHFESLVGTASPTETQIQNVKNNDGLVLSDKSVIYKKDDYGAFKNYPDNTFGVTLSLLGQEFALSETDRVPTPVDVVFIIDASGSMSKPAESGSTVTRSQAVVKAVNGAIADIMGTDKEVDKQENRVGVVVYSSGSWDILDLDRYSPNSSGEYITLNSGNIYSASGVKDGNGKTVTQKTDSLQQSGTYTQSGIARAAAMFDRVKDTNYEVTIGKAESLRTYKTERQPVFILLSDGDPTICTPNYTDVLSGPHYGSGAYPSSDNNKGIHGYYTILSANYYKSMVGIHYDKPAMFYTVGMGIYDGLDEETRYKDLSASSATSDHYKRAVLNPTGNNISDLNSNSPDVQNRDTTAKQLLDLLNNSFADEYVTVLSETSKSAFSQLGLPTQSKVPVIANPYESGYSYAENAYFGELGDDELSGIFSDVFEASLKYKNYGFILRKRSSAEMTDPIGEGMQLVSDPVLNYGGKNYTHTSKSTSGNVTTYSYNYKYVPTDGNAFRANLDEIVVTVTTDPDTGTQTVHMIVPDDVLPAYSPCESVDVEWYYEALPARLIYQVGLTDEAKTAIAGLDAGESLTYYTNRFDKNDFTQGAYTTIKPTTDNPYYKPTGAYHPKEHEKTQNITDTADYYSDTVDGTTQYDGEDAMQVMQYLGNNGKLVFTSDGTNKEILPEKKPDIFKWIDAFRDGADNPDTELDNTASDLTDLYRLYLNLGPESAYEAIDVAFVLDCSSSMRRKSDAADILGHNKVSRKAAMNSLLNGLDTKAAKGTDNTSTLYPNGLISQIKKINERNKIAVAWYAGNGGIFYSWGSGDVVKNTAEDLSSTNYVAGLHYAKELFNSDSVKNDGRKKYMVFMSDGTPTAYSPSIDDVSTYVDYSNADETELKNRTDEAIKKFKEEFPDVTIFTVGIGSFELDYLDSLSSSNSTIASTDFTQIMKDLDIVVTHGVGHFRKLKITDILSADLEYADPIDIVVKKVPNDSTDGSGEILYQNGVILNEELLKEVKFEKDKRTITVTFMPDYEEQGGYRYSLSYNVKVKQKLYDDYAANVAAGKDGYDGTVGNHSTDYIYNGNVTSSEKPGFHSNEKAWIDYERVAVDGKVTVESEIYDHPVVQVDTDRIIVSKQWIDGYVNHSADSITVKLQMKYNGSDYIDIGKTAVLSEKNAWHYTFDELPKGYEYRVIETSGKAGYMPRYDFDTAENVMTITNKLATADIKLRKTDDAGNVITDNPASFALYSDAECVHLIEEFKTGDDGFYTLSGLDSGMTYYLKETAAPNGYRMLTAVKSFTINADGSLSTPDGDPYITAFGDVVTVKNKTGVKLPHTGGIGIYLIYALGFLCIVTVFIMGCRMTRRRRERRGDE